MTTSKTLPGTSGLPFLGETPAFLYDQLAFLDTRVRAYGTVFRTHLLRLPTLVSCSYTATLALLSSPNLSAAAAYAEFLLPLYPAPNLLLSPDRSPLRHRVHRSFLPSLSPSALHPLLPRLRALVNAHLDALATRIQALPARAAPLRPYAFFKALVQRTLLPLLLGPLSSADLSHLVAHASTHFNAVVAPPVHVDLPFASSARARAARSYHALDKQLARLVARRMAHAPAQPACVLDDIGRRLKRDGQGGDTGQVERDLVQFLMLLLSPAVVKSVASALASVVSELRAPRNRGVAETVADGAGVHAVVMEVVRMHPPLAGGMRLTEGEGATVAGHAVGKGWRVWYSTRHCNRDAGVYEQADAFRPARWTGAMEGSAGCPFAKPGEMGGQACPTPLSFGAGRRHCPGRDVAWMVMVEAAQGFARRFEVEEGVAGGWRFLPVLREAADKEVMVRMRR